MSSERERELEELLAKLIRPLKDIPFEIVIRSLYGVAVLPFDLGEEANKTLLDQVAQAARNTCQAIRAKPIKRARPNEVGNDIEKPLISALVAQGLHAAAPKTKKGRGKSTGYPDIKIETGGVPLYLEVKTYAAKNHDTTQRSFYVSPSDDPKVTEAGYHLAVGFEIERAGDLYKPVAFKVIDLYGLKCDMKSEFNSDNRRLYDPARVLIEERI